MNLSQQITKALIDDIKVRIFEESFPRIRQCLGELTIEEVWLKPNENSNSIGNLVLHVCGNLRQYVISGIGGSPDVRERSKEFSEKGPLPSAALLELMTILENDLKAVFSTITDEQLIDVKTVQGFTMSVTSILIHITEHLSYHVGQIAYATKQKKNVDLKFYGDMDLDVKSG